MQLNDWNLDTWLAEFEAKRNSVQDAHAFSELRNAYLGKKQGVIGQLLKALREQSPERKRVLGRELNIFKKTVEEAFKAGASNYSTQKKKAGLDLSLPGVRPNTGSLHPLTLTMNRMVDFFVKMGYDVADGPEIEDAFHNFEALNTPEDHPAREDADTFYIDENRLLRTQTSGMQIRYMLQHQPPLRMLSPGKVYRRDDDLTHSPMFQQLEGLVVGEGIHFGHLKGTLEAFARHMFGEQTNIRLRPSYFPFTEPSAEVDVTCPFCSSGCRVCKKTGWIEILGSGMVDPNVFAHVDYDSERYTGFAFGIGIERVAMLAYSVPDIRYFFQNDGRFLDQFKVG